MSLLSSLDNYCERIDFSFWSEPVNALTNLSFLAAFIYGLYQLNINKTQLPLKKLKLLKWINFTIFLTAIGSFLFHTVANVLSMWGDILPILLFLLSTIYYLFCFELHWEKKKIYLFLTGFLFVSVILCFPPFNKLLNGSLLYAPTLLTLGYVSRTISHFRWVMGLFFVSLVARTTDSMFCEMFPLGTHFLWHVLNGVVMALSFKVLCELESP